MTLVQCLAGPTETVVGGNTYSFEKDRADRFVADVHNYTHVMILVGLVHYIEVQPLPMPGAPGITFNWPLPTPLPVEPPVKVGPPPTVPVGATTPAPVTIPASPPAVGEQLLTAPVDAAKGPSTETQPVVEVTPAPVDTPPATTATAPVAETPPVTTPTEPQSVTPPAAATTDVNVDSLVKISGIGEATAKRLADKGITTFAQIAALTKEQIAELDTALGLKGGIERNQWAEQAKALIAAGVTETPPKQV